MKRILAIFLIGFVVCSNGAVTRSLDEIRAYEDFLRNSVNGKPIESKGNQNAEEISGKFEGDIILTDDQINDMLEVYASRNGLIAPSKHWPNGIVYYEFEPSKFNSEQIAAVEAALADVSRATCVVFRRKTASTPTYIKITANTDGCYSRLGYLANPGQVLNLAPNVPGKGCFNYGTIIHEFMHALGFYHMQSAHDRDEFIRVNWNKIQAGKENQFQKYDSTYVSHFGQKYDYGSLMHYGLTVFSNDGSRTMDPLKTTTETIGQRTKMSAMDIGRIKKMYNCP